MTAASASSQPVAQPSEGSERTRWRGFCTACRQVLGMPDYERYLAHAAVLHPGAPVLTRGEYFEQAIERRYGGGGTRCC
jgi:uncharacterized short protein YbdD (DUF466 family)